MSYKTRSALVASVPILFLLIFLMGCYPKGPEYYSDLDLTATDYDSDYKFEEQKYYWLPDTVRIVTNIEDIDISESDVQALLNQIETNFTNRNYKRLSVDPDSAQFVISVNVIASRNAGVGWIPGPPCYPGWWGCWPGYYPPYWGGYYAYSYTTGSVIMNWYDPQAPPIEDEDGNERQPVHWVGAFNGLLSSSQSNNAGRIEFSINQAFEQSPYILSK